MLLDIAMSKYAHAYVLAHTPLGYIAVRIATVIGKSTNTASLRGVNVL